MTLLSSWASVGRVDAMELRSPFGALATGSVSESADTVQMLDNAGYGCCLLRVGRPSHEVAVYSSSIAKRQRLKVATHSAAPELLSSCSSHLCSTENSSASKTSNALCTMAGLARAGETVSTRHMQRRLNPTNQRIPRISQLHG